MIDACFTFITSYDLLQALGILSVIAFLLFVRSQYLRVEQVRNQCTVRYEPQSCMDFYNYITQGFHVGHRFHTKFISTCNNISAKKNFLGTQKPPEAGSKFLNFLGTCSQTQQCALYNQFFLLPNKNSCLKLSFDRTWYLSV